MGAACWLAPPASVREGTSRCELVDGAAPTIPSTLTRSGMGYECHRYGSNVALPGNPWLAGPKKKKRKARRLLAPAAGCFSRLDLARDAASTPEPPSTPRRVGVPCRGAGARAYPVAGAPPRSPARRRLTSREAFSPPRNSGEGRAKSTRDGAKTRRAVPGRGRRLWRADVVSPGRPPGALLTGRVASRARRRGATGRT